MQMLVRRRVDAKDATRTADMPVALLLVLLLLQASLMNWRGGGTKAHADEWLRAIYVHKMLQGNGFMVGLAYYIHASLLLCGPVSISSASMGCPGTDRFSGCHVLEKNCCCCLLLHAMVLGRTTKKAE